MALYYDELKGKTEKHDNKRYLILNVGIITEVIDKIDKIGKTDNRY